MVFIVDKISKQKHVSCGVKNILFRFFESIHEIELIIINLLEDATIKAVTIEQIIDVLDIFANYQSRTVRSTIIIRVC